MSWAASACRAERRPTIIERLNREIMPGLADATVKARLAAVATTPIVFTSGGIRPTCQLQIVLILLVGLMLLQRRHAARFASLMILAFVLSGLWQPEFNSVETARSFFGVHRVAETPDGRHRFLIHGTTIHGAGACSSDAPAKSPPEPLTYFYFGGPISQTIEAARAAKGGLGRSRSSVSAAAASRAIGARARRGRFSRSIPKLFGSRAIRASSASCQTARRMPASCWATPG